MYVQDRMNLLACQDIGPPVGCFRSRQFLHVVVTDGAACISKFVVLLFYLTACGLFNQAQKVLAEWQHTDELERIAKPSEGSPTFRSRTSEVFAACRASVDEMQQAQKVEVGPECTKFAEIAASRTYCSTLLYARATCSC